MTSPLALLTLGWPPFGGLLRFLLPPTCGPVFPAYTPTLLPLVMCSHPIGHGSKFILGLSSVDSKKVCFFHILCRWLKLVTRAWGTGKVWSGALSPLGLNFYTALPSHWSALPPQDLWLLWHGAYMWAKVCRGILACPESWDWSESPRRVAGPLHASLRKKTPLSHTQRAAGPQYLVAFLSWWLYWELFQGCHLSLFWGIKVALLLPVGYVRESMTYTETRGQLQSAIRTILLQPYSLCPGVLRGL